MPPARERQTYLEAFPLPASEKTVLFIDFDNTISLGDVLDSVIGKFSRTTQWAQWQTEWRENRISTLDCLRRQVGDLEVDKDTLLEFVRHAAIDADFVHLQDWAASTGTDLVIVSDNFEVILREILRRHGVIAPPIFANSLTFEGKRVIPAFPYRSPSCARCAHCKASHFVRYEGYRILYVGDGLSDICPAVRADRVFAKDSLAAYLSAQGKPFTGFENLGDVVKCLWTDASGRDRAAPVVETSCGSDIPSAR
jgi:2-hydroxy-3-keto-5-methylthiopentenyl-1-phosphate phosphatase